MYNKMMSKETLSVRKVFNHTRYALPAQSTYKWNSSDVVEMVGALVGAFLTNYSSLHTFEEVTKYRGFCLGTITTFIENEGNGEKVVLDGHQVLTTLLLILIYLQRRGDAHPGWSDLKDRFMWEHYGEVGYNPHAPDFASAIEALCLSKKLDEGTSETASQIVGRYHDIENNFPAAIDSRAWPYFVRWLLDNVTLNEVAAYSDEAASILFKAQAYDTLTYKTEPVAGWLR